MPPSHGVPLGEALPPPGLLIRDAEVAGARTSVRVRGGAVMQLDPDLAPRHGEVLIDARGGALLPGLHDHHLHLLAMAAARQSVPVGPPNVTTAEQFAEVLSAAASQAGPGAWVRAVGYHESVAGDLDRDRLDQLAPRTPVRVQHRSGALWMLNSAALDALGPPVTGSGFERDERGRLTGRLLREDTWLRERLQTVDDAPAPDLAAVGAELLRFGITGVTDATPDLDEAALGLLVSAVTSGVLPLRLHLLGAPDGPARDDAPNSVTQGPRKLLLHDHALPDFDEVTARIAASHASGRPVAVHCVTRESLVLTLAALEAVGTLPGDRIEHAAIVPPETREVLAGLGAHVVTQPGFVAERGDAYLDAVDPADIPLLYPYATLLAAGVRVVPSSDAPFGPADPWRVIAAAATRLTATGRLLGGSERVPARTALEGYLSAPAEPGDRPRRVRVGAPADLCLLRTPLRTTLQEPAAELVHAVVTGERILMVG